MELRLIAKKVYRLNRLIEVLQKELKNLQFGPDRKPR